MTKKQQKQQQYLINEIKYLEADLDSITTKIMRIRISLNYIKALTIKPHVVPSSNDPGVVSEAHLARTGAP